MKKILLLILFTIGQFDGIRGTEFKGIQFLVNILMGDFMQTKNGNDGAEQQNLENIPLSWRQTNFSFIDYISHSEKRTCNLHENYDGSKNVDSNEDKVKNSHVKCLPSVGNGTIQIVQSIKEVVTLLAPHGNNTKRNQIGKCVLILFFTRSCPGSVIVGPHFVALGKVFPNLTLAAIDAFKYSSLNTEFGIIGLPTIMLFHQGRPVMRFNETHSTVNSFINFIVKYTDMRPPSMHNAYVTSEDFNGPLPSKVEYETDYYLYLAWIFIVLCTIYHFTKSHLYSQIIEMIKRNWRESEAQIQ